MQVMQALCQRKLFAAVVLLLSAFFAFPSITFAANVTDDIGDTIGSIGSQIVGGEVPDTIVLDGKERSLTQSVADKTVTDTAKDFSDYFSKCLVCTLFSVIFDSINELSYTVWEKSKTGFISLLAILLALWLLYKFGTAIGSLVPQSPADFWRSVGIVLFKAMFASAILVAGIGDLIGTYIVGPVVYGASGFTEAIVKGYTNLNTSFDDMSLRYKGSTNVNTGGNDYLSFGRVRELGDNETNIIPYEAPLTAAEIKDLSAQIEAETDPEKKRKLQDLMMRSVLSNTTSAEGLVSCAQGMTEYADEVVTAAIAKEKELNRLAEEMAKQQGLEYTPVYSAGARIHGVLNVGTKVAFMCMIDAMNRELAFGKGLGSALMKYGLTAYKWNNIGLPDLPVIFAGGLIWLACFILTVLFSFKLLDACFRLGVMCIIMPLLLIAYVFPSTKDYAKRGLTTLIQIVCVFVTMAVILALVILLIMQSFQTGVPNNSEQLNIQTLYNLGRIEEIHNQMNLSARSFLGALACLVFAIMSLSMVDSTAAEFSGMSFETAVGDSAGAMLTQGAFGVTQAGTRVAKLAGAKLKNRKKDKGEDNDSKGATDGGDDGADEDGGSFAQSKASSRNSYSPEQNSSLSSEQTGDEGGKSFGNDFDVSDETGDAFSSMFSDDGKNNPLNDKLKNSKDFDTSKEAADSFSSMFSDGGKNNPLNK